MINEAFQKNHGHQHCDCNSEFGFRIQRIEVTSLTSRTTVWKFNPLRTANNTSQCHQVKDRSSSGSIFR